MPPTPSQKRLPSSWGVHQDLPVTCRIAVQPSSRRAHLVTATILLASGSIPYKSSGGSPNPSGTGAAAFTWGRQPTLLQPEPGPSQELAPRAVPPSPPRHRSLLQPPVGFRVPKGHCQGGPSPIGAGVGGGHPGEPRCSVGTTGRAWPPAQTRDPMPCAGAGRQQRQGQSRGRWGCRDSVHDFVFSPSLHPRQSQAMEADHMPPQRSSPFICPNPWHRGLFVDPAHLPLKEAATKVDAGLKTAWLQPAPAREGSAASPSAPTTPGPPGAALGRVGSSGCRLGVPVLTCRTESRGNNGLLLSPLGRERSCPL